MRVVGGNGTTGHGGPISLPERLRNRAAPQAPPPALSLKKLPPSTAEALPRHLEWRAAVANPRPCEGQADFGAVGAGDDHHVMFPSRYVGTARVSTPEPSGPWWSEAAPVRSAAPRWAIDTTTAGRPADGRARRAPAAVVAEVVRLGRVAKRTRDLGPDRVAQLHQIPCQVHLLGPPPATREATNPHLMVIAGRGRPRLPTRRCGAR